MAPVAIKPVKLAGPWTDGYVLDRQTVSSIPTGDPYHPFDTERTELGELLFQFKYRNKADALSIIVDTGNNEESNGSNNINKEISTKHVLENINNGSIGEICLGSLFVPSTAFLAANTSAS